MNQLHYLMRINRIRIISLYRLIKKSISMKGGDYWSIDYFVKNQYYFHTLLKDYVVDHTLKIWDHLFNKHTPSIFCMNSKVSNPFFTQENISI